MLVTRHGSRCGERVENLFYVTWIRRLNPVHNIRIVSGRFSSRYVVRGFGFCDLNSPDVSRGAIVRRAIVTRMAFVVIRLGVFARLLYNTEAILPIMATNLFQRSIETCTIILPLSVCRTLILTSNIHTVCCDMWHG